MDIMSYAFKISKDFKSLKCFEVLGCGRGKHVFREFNTWSDFKCNHTVQKITKMGYNIKNIARIANAVQCHN